MKKTLQDAIESVVTTGSQVQRVAAIKRVSRLFYWTCRQAGLERNDILSLAAEIVGCFNDDIKGLQHKLEHHQDSPD
jgi:hypothetical protein